jgi:hypothetical protein
MDKRKGANNDLQKITQKTKDRATRTPLKPGLISVTNISLYRGGQFYWWRKQEYPEKTTDLLYHIMLYRVEWAGFELTTLVVIGNNGIGRYKSDYHTITTITATI